MAARIGITQANLSILKTGKAKAIRFNTLNAIWPSIATMEWLINRAKCKQPFHGCYVVGHRSPHSAAKQSEAALRGYRCENALHAFFIADGVIRGTPWIFDTVVGLESAHLGGRRALI